MGVKMSFKKVIVIMLAQFVLTNICDTYAQNYDYASAIKIANIGDNILTTAKGLILYTENPPDTTSEFFNNLKKEVKKYNSENPGKSREIRLGDSSVIEYVYDRSGNKIKYTKTNNSKDIRVAKIVKSYDGEKTTVLTYQINKGLINPEAFVIYSPFADPFFSPFFYGYYLSRNNVSDVLMTKSIKYEGGSVDNIEYIKSEYVNNNMTDVFSGTSSDGSMVTIWLVKNYLYRPVRVLTQSNVERGGIELDVTQLSEL